MKKEKRKSIRNYETGGRIAENRETEAAEKSSNHYLNHICFS
jgi:hypothetical protein